METLPASAPASPEEINHLVEKAAYSLQLWQLAQPWKLFQPLHQLLLKK
jgi:hypothetical protein